MRHLASGFLSMCLLLLAALFAGPARAGDYSGYDNGYSYRAYRHDVRVWYSSSCCYRRLVRHEATVRYVPAERYGYDERPYRYGYYGRGYRYADYPYSRSYIVSNWRGGYTGDCYTRRLRVSDGDGGWFWSARRVCD